MPRSAWRPPTRRLTLYLLSGIAPTVDGMIEALDTDNLDQHGCDLSFPDALGVPALWVHGSAPSNADWCADAAITTGIQMSYTDQRSGGALLLAVDGDVYAISYGAGRWFIKDECKDQRFGLRFGIRQLHPQRISRLVQRRPGTRGRQDAILVPAGLPIWCYGLEGYAGIVGHIGGELKTTALTFGTDQTRPVRIDGAAGLNARLGVRPADLVADIRAIAAVCRNQAPDPSLEPIENIMPVGTGPLAEQLDADLEELLGWPAADAGDFLSPVVPTARLDDFLAAQSLIIKIGNATPPPVDHLDLRDFLNRTRHQKPGTRVKALHDGHVHMFADPDAGEPIGNSAAINWLEATLSIGSRRFFLMDGTWYEIGATYLTSISTQVKQLLNSTPSLDLPAWDPSWPERRYNEHVQDVRAGYLNLDRDLIRAGLHQTTGFEVCDLLGPNNELVLIKRAKGSAPLSHLFSQALVSVQTLTNNSDARTRLATKVDKCSRHGRHLPPNFQPKKVAFGILLKHGDLLTADTLFPFSQVTLAHTARELQSHYQTSVEVIGIPAQPP
jgi:uncharacterized protein (TIGR04141 family)